MSFLDDLGKNISTKGAAAGVAAKEITETIKIKNAISAQQQREKEKYYKIGKIFYDFNKDNEVDEEYAKLFEDITVIKEDIAAKNKLLEEFKKTTTCPQCGGEVAKDVIFCGNCGYKIK